MGDIGFFQTAKNTSYIRSAKKMMAGCFCCFRCCDPNSLRSGHVRLEDLPKVCLDTSRMGRYNNSCVPPESPDQLSCFTY